MSTFARLPKFRRCKPAPAPMVTVTRHGDGLPGVPAIYFVWRRNRIVYVGQTGCLNKRATLSHGKIKPGEFVSWLPHNGPLASRWFDEAYYIGMYKPRRNCPLTLREFTRKS